MTIEQADRIIELLETLLNYQSMFIEPARLINTYGVVYVPLVFVCVMLWWFLKQFLHKY